MSPTIYTKINCYDRLGSSGGTTPGDDCTVFTAIVFVLTSGCAWRDLLTG